MEKYIAELIGTFVLVFINNGVVANVLLKKTKGNTNQNWMLITFAAGIAVTFGIYVSMFRSGAHINPAVTIAMLTIGKIAIVDAIFYIVFQLIGAMIGALSVYLSYKQHFDATEDETLKLACFSTGPAIRNKRWNIITEILATFMLVGIVVTVTSEQVQLDQNLVPIIIGLLVMVLGVSLGGSTGFAMNPARDFGPRVMHALLRLGDSDWGYAIVPIMGPIIGGTLGAIIFTIYLGGI